MVDFPLSPEPVVCVSMAVEVVPCAGGAAQRTQQQDLAFAAQAARVLLQLAVNGLAALLLLAILGAGAHADAHGVCGSQRLAAAGCGRGREGATGQLWARRVVAREAAAGVARAARQRLSAGIGVAGGDGSGVLGLECFRRGGPGGRAGVEGEQRAQRRRGPAARAGTAQGAARARARARAWAWVWAGGCESEWALEGSAACCVLRCWRRWVRAGEGGLCGQSRLARQAGADDGAETPRRAGGSAQASAGCTTAAVGKGQGGRGGDGLTARVQACSRAGVQSTESRRRSSRRRTVDALRELPRCRRVGPAS